MTNEKWFTAEEVARDNMLPMLPTSYLIKRAINSGKLKAVVLSQGQAKRYSIKESWIEKFKRDFEAGKIKRL